MLIYQSVTLPASVPFSHSSTFQTIAYLTTAVQRKLLKKKNAVFCFFLKKTALKLLLIVEAN